MRPDFAALALCLCGYAASISSAVAQPVTGSGAQVAWLTPKEGALLDGDASTQKSVSLRWPRKLPEHGFLAARLSGNESAWVHLSGDAPAAHVRFLFLSGSGDTMAGVDAIPQERTPGDFVFTAPPGSPVWLAMAVRPGQPAPSAQVWIGTVDSPGFRWELWEELAKAWAARNQGEPPLPPELVAMPEITALMMVHDAVALAQAESPPTPPAGVAPLLRAEALLADLPAREPFFPYFGRKDLTASLAKSRLMQKVDGQVMVEVTEARPLQFTLDGPGLLRIEARARFAVDAKVPAGPLDVVLHSGKRLLALANEQLPPVDTSPVGPVSAARRLLLAAAPGKHPYELRVQGGPAFVSVMMHHRAIHAEDLTSRSEDIPWLLKRAHAAGGVLAEVLAAETAFLLLDDDRARALFQKVVESATSPRLRAFALLRLAALSPDANMDAEAPLFQQALSALGDGTDAATVRLRQILVAQHLMRVAATSGQRALPSTQDVALLQRNPSALLQSLGVVGPLLRYVPGQRSLALPLLTEALLRSPLDEAVRDQLTHEWFIGTRWASLLSTELGSAERSELLAPQRASTSCEESLSEGLRAYGRLPQSAGVLDVAESQAPRHSLRRFHLIALRTGQRELGWADLVLDGEHTRLPLVLPTESIPIALAAGRHTVQGSLGADPRAALLAPCWLVAHATDAAKTVETPLLIEHRYSELKGKGGLVRVLIPEPGTPAFLGLEVRASPDLRGGRLRLRTDQGELGTVAVYGHATDNTIISRLTVGPPVTVVLPVPAATRVLEITRDDDGPPLLVRALVRRSLASPPSSEARWPASERDPDLLEQLRQATRALRAASGATAQAAQRLHRAEILIALGALALARFDLETALPILQDDSSLVRARALLAATGELPLVPPQTGPAGPRSAMVLAAGADLPDTKPESTCVTNAIARFDSDPAAARQAAAGCGESLGRYVAARLEEQGGSNERAAQHYAAAYRQSLAAGRARPALAREGALRFADRGPGRDGTLAVALALTAAEDNDPDGARAVDRVRGLAYAEAVRGIDRGPEVRWPERAAAQPSLRAALADEPWESGIYLEAHPGQTAESEFVIDKPLRVRVETLCDVRGGLPGQGPPCELNVEADGVPVVDLTTGKLAAGERAIAGTLSFDKGAHRIRVAMLPKNTWGVVFVHLLTSRPLNGASTTQGDDGYSPMPIVPPLVRRYIATPAQPVQLRAQGPTALRLDALVDPEADKGGRGLAVELLLDGKPVVTHTYPVCALPSERQAAVKPEKYDCRSALRVPLVKTGTYQISLRPVGTPRMALALSLYDQPTVTAPDGSLAEAESALPKDAIAQPERSGLKALRQPQSNLARELGTLLIQQSFSYTNAGPSTPTDSGQTNTTNSPQNEQIPGDTYAETQILYHRKLDGVPIWVQGAAFLRLRDGTPSYGGSGLFFARVPVIQLRIYTQLDAFTQSIQSQQEVGVALHSYLERSFPILPHFFILPRFAFNYRYQSLGALPVAISGEPVTPIDSQVFNPYNQKHPTGIYGQLLLWWVPFINMITYAQVRVISNQSVQQLDTISARAGFDVAIGTTELTGYYDFTQLFVDDARMRAIGLHQLAGELHQSLWLHRNHRMGLWVSGNVEVVTGDATIQGGLYWEGSPGRGLDDYSTPVINLPQQLGRGRGIMKPEETLR